MSAGSKLGKVAEEIRAEAERLGQIAYDSMQALPPAAQVAMVLSLARAVMWNIHHDDADTYESQAGAYRDIVAVFYQRLLATMPDKAEVLGPGWAN